MRVRTGDRGTIRVHAKPAVAYPPVVVFPRVSLKSVFRRFGWGEVLLLLSALVIVLVAHAFFELADDVREGDTKEFDEWVVRSLRKPDDPAVPVGPPWLREVGLDFTALGSVAVLLTFTAAVVGFLLLQRRRRLTVLIVVSVFGGMLLNTALKQFFDRQRPTVVPHLREVTTPSFPSGHAAFSAVVYLTLGALLAGAVKGSVTKGYVLTVAMILTTLVGVSRVYLGVHYPTDVLAGWAVGLVWALFCWTVERVLQRIGALREAKPPPDETTESSQPASEELPTDELRQEAMT